MHVLMIMGKCLKNELVIKKGATHRGAWVDIPVNSMYSYILSVLFPFNLFSLLVSILCTLYCMLHIPSSGKFCDVILGK